jgi:hypothetical protein
VSLMLLMLGLLLLGFGAFLRLVTSRSQI